MAKKPKTAPKTRKKSGRPSGYDPLIHPDRAFKLAVLGCTDVEIAEQFCISEDCLNNWKHAHPEFYESLRAGKRPANAAVADALRKRALGFEWEEEVVTKVKDGPHSERVVITKVKRIVPPDTMAASLFLRNREKLTWRDKVEIENVHKIEAVPDDKLQSELAELLGKAAAGGAIEGTGTPEIPA